MNEIKFFDFCSGIGGGRLGLQQAGFTPVGYSDTSRLSATTYQLMFDTTGEKNWGNLKKIDTSKLPKFDVLIAGFPCQTFSVIGRREGFDDSRGQIIFHIARILTETKPKCFILENVKGLITHDKGSTLKKILLLLEESGYDVTYKVLNSLNYGVPQMRQRVFFVGFDKTLGLHDKFVWPEEVPPPPLTEYLIDRIPATNERLEIMQYYLNNKTNCGSHSISDLLQMEGKVIDTRMSDLRIYDGKVPTLRSQRDGILYVYNHRLMVLSGYEALLLQGFPIEYADKVKNVVSDRHLLMQAGNAMTVNVIKALGLTIKKILQQMNRKATSLNDLSDNINNTKMSWENFENECCEYLKKTYGTSNLTIKQTGGSDSTMPDIQILKNGKEFINLEVKEPDAQSGQFVVLEDDIKSTFVYSGNNKTPQNQYTQKILDEMNNNYSNYSNPGTKGVTINVPAEVSYKWIISYYLNIKKSTFVMTKWGTSFIIIPTQSLSEYFDVEAVYRVKKSGSSNAKQKDFTIIKKLLNTKNVKYSNLHSSEEGKIIVTLPDCIETTFTIQSSPKDFFFRKKSNQDYIVTKLSNTKNANVIFTISLKELQQNTEHLKKFENALKK